MFDLETLAFLEVNEAAVHHYGYTRKEFLAMTISEIRQPTIGAALRERKPSDMADRGLVWRHRRKDGKSH